MPFFDHPLAQVLLESVQRLLPRYLPGRDKRRRRLGQRFAFDLASVVWRHRSCFLLDEFVIDPASLVHLLSDLQTSCPAIVDLKLIRLLVIDEEAIFIYHHAAMIERIQNASSWLSSIAFINVSPMLSEPELIQHSMIPEFEEIFSTLVSSMASDSLIVKIMFPDSTLSLSSICAPLLEYPVCYILRKGQGDSFRPNCLGNVPLVVYDVALKLAEENVTAFRYSCPAAFCQHVILDKLASKGFIITSEAVTLPVIPL